MFILDSYDEFARKCSLSDEPTTEVIEALSHQRLTNCRLLVTSRPWRAEEFSHLQRVYTKYEVRGFTSKQVEEYIKKFFNNDPSLAESLIEYLKMNDFCPGIASVPLMTQLFCMFWMENNKKEKANKKKKELPKKIGQLYTRIIKTLLSHRKSKKPACEKGQLSRALADLGKIAFTGLWPPEDKLVFSATEIQEEKISPKTARIALDVGILCVDENRSERVGDRERNDSSIFDDLSDDDDSADGESTGDELDDDETDSALPKHLRFFHKTIQEKCAGERLAILPEAEIVRHLAVLDSVKTCMRVRMILQFACGVNLEATDLIMKRLEDLHQSEIHSMLASYYQDDLPEEKVRKVQQFIELCLICNYESGAARQYVKFLSRLFPNDQMRFLGMSAYVGDALEHFLKHLQKDVKSLTVVELPRAGNTVYYLSKSRVLEDAHRDVHRVLKTEQGTKLDDMYDECVRKGILKDRGLRRSSSNVSNLLADVQMWERFHDMQPSSEINFTPVIRAFQYINLSVLDITDVSLGRQCDALVECIENKHLSSAVTLKCRQIGLETHQVQRLCVAMRKGQLPKLKEIDISRNAAGIPIELGEAVKELNMTHVNVSFMTKEAVQMKKFLGGISQYGPNLTELRVEGNPTNQEEGNTLLESFRDMEQLEYLGFAGVSHSESVPVSNLHYLKHLKELRVWDITEYLDQVLAGVSDSLSSLSQLSYLSIRAEEAPTTVSPSLINLIEALKKSERIRRLLLLGIFFDQGHLTQVVEIGRRHNYNFFW